MRHMSDLDIHVAVTELCLSIAFNMYTPWSITAPATAKFMRDSDKRTVARFADELIRRAAHAAR